MAPTRRARHFRRFVIVHVILVASAIGVLASWNIVIDPYGRYRLVELEGMAEHRSTNGTRRTKAETASEGGWDIVLFGSSVVATGFRRDDPSLLGVRAYNFGLAGTSVFEQAGALRVALSADPPPRRVILFVDFDLFYASRGLRNEFLQSPLNERYSALEYHASNLVGAQATEHSFQAYRNWSRKKLPKYDSFGHRGTSLRRGKEPWRNLFVDELDLLVAAEPIEYAVDRLAVLEEMLRACVANRVETHVAIPPAHATRLELRRRQHPDAWVRWKKDLATLVARVNASSPGADIVLRDFAIDCRYTNEPVPAAGDSTTELRWFWDGLHFQTRLGEIVLARILSDEEGDVPEFGARLLPDAADGGE